MIGIRLIWECPSCGNIIKNPLTLLGRRCKKEKSQNLNGVDAEEKVNSTCLTLTNGTWLVMPQGTKIVR